MTDYRYLSVGTNNPRGDEPLVPVLRIAVGKQLKYTAIVLSKAELLDIASAAIAAYRVIERREARP